MVLSSQYFKPLTGLRFIAALMVFISHFMPRTFHQFINQLIVEFEAGVPIFFVLSGFLIGYRYYDPGTNVKGGVTNYFITRFVRIYPLYFLVTILNILQYKLNLQESILNLTFLHGFFEDFVFRPLPHTWSLTVECTFYFLIPLIFFFIRKGGEGLFLTVIFLFIGLALTAMFSNSSNINFFGGYNFMLITTFFGRSFEFLIGVKFALLLKSGKLKIYITSIHTYISVVLFILLIITLAGVGGIYNFPGTLLHNLVLPVIIVFMLYGLMFTQNIISTVLSTPLFQLLGNSSYAFFLIHYGFWQKFMINYMFTDIFLELGTTMVLSIILYKCIEEPLVKFTKQRLITKSN